MHTLVTNFKHCFPSEEGQCRKECALVSHRPNLRQYARTCRPFTELRTLKIPSRFDTTEKASCTDGTQAGRQHKEIPHSDCQAEYQARTERKKPNQHTLLPTRTASSEKTALTFAPQNLGQGGGAK